MYCRRILHKPQQLSDLSSAAPDALAHLKRGFKNLLSRRKKDDSQKEANAEAETATTKTDKAEEPTPTQPEKSAPGSTPAASNKDTSKDTSSAPPGP